MWHLDEIIRRNNPTPPEVAFDDFMANEDAKAEDTFEFIVPEMGEYPWLGDASPESVDSSELWRRKTITQYSVIDDEGYVIEVFNTYEEARDAAMNDEQIVPLTGEGFVKAYL